MYFKSARVIAFLFLTGWVSTAKATTFIVTNPNDSGANSLRGAISAANANSGADTITFASNVTGTITLTTGELALSDDTTLVGPGSSTLTVSGNGASRVFSVSAGKTVIISGLTIANGKGAAASGGVPSGGGGISNDGAVTVNNCAFPQNNANYGSAIYNYLGTVTVNNCVFANNTASYVGTIYNYAGQVFGGTINVNNCDFHDNSAASYGGAICIDARGTLNITNSNFTSNAALQGSAIWNAGTLKMSGSTLSNNQTPSTGDGALYNYRSPYPGIATVENCTFSGNTSGSGGAILNSSGGSLTVNSSTFAGNTAINPGGGASIYNTVGGSVNLTNSIFKTSTSNGNLGIDPGSSFTSNGYNLSSDSGGGFLTATGDRINTDPLLGPLQNNGGPTPTQALLAGSPAIDTGNTNLATDQRGYARPAGSAADIGAFEQGATPPVPALSSSTGINISEFRLSGPNGSTDEFVELYNTTGATLNVSGYSLQVATPAASTTVITLPIGTMIPSRGHLLIEGTGYSLGSYSGTNNIVLPGGTDLPANASLGLFNGATPLDYAGIAGSPFVETNGVSSPPSATDEYSFARRLQSGFPQDTGNNSNDFVTVDTTATSGDTSSVLRLGAPGPESTLSPTQRNALIGFTVADPTVAANNNVRNAGNTGTNATLGTLAVRRRITNNTGAAISVLRLRAALISAGTSPNGTTADVRLLSSALAADGSSLTLNGLPVYPAILEQPPTQPNGGGLHSSLSVALPGGTLAPGASINVEILFGVQVSGTYNATLNFEVK